MFYLSCLPSIDLDLPAVLSNPSKLLQPVSQGTDAGNNLCISSGRNGFLALGSGEGVNTVKGSFCHI